MFNFGRRINRSTFFVGLAASLLLTVGLISLAYLLPDLGMVGDTLVGLFIILIALVLFVYWVCLLRQRANDVGWHPLALTFLAFFSPFSLVLGLLPGQHAHNKFGSVPRRDVKLKPRQ